MPWGFNYDHDERFRLLEDYWGFEWDKVAADFSEMRDLGANVVRVHLQLGRFLRGPDSPNEGALARLEQLAALAEQAGLYLDITGLGSYRKEDAPAWYDGLSEEGRWSAQARFWEAVAGRLAGSRAVFCFNLMNEPVIPSDPRAPGQWLAPPFEDSYHYVEFIALDPRSRPRAEIARRWVAKMAAAVRRSDRDRLVTVGFFPWGLPPEAVAPELDFLSLHIYPEASRVPEAIRSLARYALGKPVLIEETFPLRCSLEEFKEFIAGTRSLASGWLGFYHGKTLEEARAGGTPADALIAGWLGFFREEAARLGH